MAAAHPPTPSPYEAWLAKLSPAARKAVTAPAPRPADDDDEAADYLRWQAGLSAAARQATSAMVPRAAPPPPGSDDEVLRYGCVEHPDGEPPVVRLFRNAEALVRHLGACEGADNYVVSFWGVYLKLSRGPQRYLRLPGGRRLLTVPRGGVGPVHEVDADLVNFDWQEDSFVGPPELSESVMAAKLEELHRAKARDEEGEDEDDDEDDDED